MADPPSDVFQSTAVAVPTFTLTPDEFSSTTTSSSSVLTSPATSDPPRLDILNHPVTEVLAMIAALLQRIIESNDALYESQNEHHRHAADRGGLASSVLAFHGRNVPAISLQSYLMRILKYCPATNEVFLSLLVYFDRISKRAGAGEFSPDYYTAQQQSQQIQDYRSRLPQQPVPETPFMIAIAKEPLPGQPMPYDFFVMDSYNIHRLVIAGVTVASKFFSDVFYKNSRYAKVGGLPLEELNHLELQFLLLSDFRLSIPLEELQRYGDLLLQFWDREVISHGTQSKEV
ncbi:cyclin-domain-containing protein [Lipomyces arxii]|uniref:cyclin-domain-containing protein n=1 Tax=Lipomyces arxii TaxID=56418 RepID=UPI0034CFFE7C